VTTVIALQCVWRHKLKEQYYKHPTPTLGQSYPSQLWKTQSINNHITVQCSCMFLTMRLKCYYRSCGYLTPFTLLLTLQNPIYILQNFLQHITVWSVN